MLLNDQICNFENMSHGIDNIQKRIGQIIHDIDPDAEVILFGSRARGESRSDSDWDILILTDYPVNVNVERKFRDRVYELEVETGEPVSLFVYSLVEWNGKQRITPFYENISKEGIRI